jgi:hypothetical protein
MFVRDNTTENGEKEHTLYKKWGFIFILFYL